MINSYLKFYFLFGLTLAIAILTPHVVRGHVFLPERYAQSAVILLDLILSYIFYRIYKRDINKINKDKKIVEKDLIDSYKYIGKVNQKIKLFDRFINYFPIKFSNNKISKENVFYELLENIIVSVLKTNKGFLRFINTANKKTVNEFHYHSEGDQFVVKLSNTKIIEGDLKDSAHFNGFDVLESDYNDGEIKSVLCFANGVNKNYDVKLVKSLLNQIHIIYFALNSKSFNNKQSKKHEQY